MRFHVTFTVRESISLSEIAGVQNRIADAIQKIMQTGKVQASGVLPDRKVFFLIEAETAEDLWKWFAPLFDVAKADIQPIVSFEYLHKLFEELQKLRY
jgi:DNA polymerase/3'-5' exonuclease PolX